MYGNREFFLDCDGVSIHVKLDFPSVQKERMPLLLLFHGLTGNMDEPHITAVSRAANDAGFVTLRPDLYGHGKSGGTLREHTILIWLTEAMRLTEFAAGLPFAANLYAAGHSQGGLTVILLGGLERDRIRALVPLSPAVNIVEMAEKGCFFGQTFDPDAVPEAVEAGEYELAGDYFRAARMLPVREAVEKYRKPVLIVHGTADETVPFPYAESLREQYADARLVPVPDDTHCFDLHTDVAAEETARFLREQERRPD